MSALANGTVRADKRLRSTSAGEPPSALDLRSSRWIVTDALVGGFYTISAELAVPAGVPAGVLTAGPAFFCALFSACAAADVPQCFIKAAGEALLSTIDLQ